MLYGNDSYEDLPHLDPRRAAIAMLYQLRLAKPTKFTLKFTIDARASSNSLWVVCLKENVDRWCILRNAERPTSDELKETGDIDPQGNNIYDPPDAIGLQIQDGIFAPRSPDRWGVIWTDPVGANTIVRRKYPLPEMPAETFTLAWLMGPGSQRVTGGYAP